jgi:hypothetical protein
MQGHIRHLNHYQCHPSGPAVRAVGKYFTQPGIVFGQLFRVIDDQTRPRNGCLVSCVFVRRLNDKIPEALATTNLVAGARTTVDVY